MPDAPDLATLVPDGMVLPAYGGRSIANLPPTVGRLLGVESGWAGPPLAADLLGALPGEVERVVVLLVDGLGWNRLRRQLADDDAGFGDLDARALLSTSLTSVAPSTTSAATTVLLANGATPIETGLVGYTFRLADRGVVANLLFWHPAWDPSAQRGDLVRWGVEPETFLPVPTLFEVLARAGVRGTALMPAPYAHSPLSRMQLRGAEVEGYLNLTDLTSKLGLWLETRAGTPGYLHAYFPDFDTLSHRDGPDGTLWTAQWRTFVWHLARLLAGLSPRARRGTLVLVTADHGHVATPFDGRRTIQDHPELLALQSSRQGGEPRHVFLYARSGATGALRDAAEAALGLDFVVLRGEDAIRAGLYGDPDRAHPDAARRVGDVILLARSGALLWDRDLPGRVLGMHGALEPDEMLVPLLAFAL